MHINILAEEAGLLIRRGGGRPLCLNFPGNGGVCDTVQHLHRVQQFVLLHIDLAQCGVQLHGGLVMDGGGEGQLGLGVVPTLFVLVGQLNGHVFVVAGEAVGGVIEPGGQPGVAVQGLESGLTQQGIPGKGPVINEQVPENAGKNQKAQH